MEWKVSLGNHCHKEARINYVVKNVGKYGRKGWKKGKSGAHVCDTWTYTKSRLYEVETE